MVLARPAASAATCAACAVAADVAASAPAAPPPPTPVVLWCCPLLTPVLRRLSCCPASRRAPGFAAKGRERRALLRCGLSCCRIAGESVSEVLECPEKTSGAAGRSCKPLLPQAAARSAAAPGALGAPWEPNLCPPAAVDPSRGSKPAVLPWHPCAMRRALPQLPACNRWPLTPRENKRGALGLARLQWKKVVQASVKKG